jgi:hypothetical protein
LNSSASAVGSVGRRDTGQSPQQDREAAQIRPTTRTDEAQAEASLTREGTRDADTCVDEARSEEPFPVETHAEKTDGGKTYGGKAQGGKAQGGAMQGEMTSSDEPYVEAACDQLSAEGGATPYPPWRELVTAALLGAERRTPPGGSVTALLDAAAVQTVRRRAGLRPTPAGPRPESAPEDPRPELPAAAARRLATLLADRAGAGGGGGGSGRRRGALPDLAELLPQWLAAANARGFRPPNAQLPALLEAARARSDLRPETLAFAGRRALWLARLNPDWRFALRHGVRNGVEDITAITAQERGEAAALAKESENENEGGGEGGGENERGGGGGQPGQTAQRLWDEGLFAERVALLTSLRRSDPAAALALLAGSWRTERADNRLMFLDVLRSGLSLADEAFLEDALGDRSRTVRSTAAELLGTLPESALAERMAERVRGCVGLDHASSRITVEAPHECGADMQRDGVTPKPPEGRGERAWWLGQLVECTPLSRWPEWFAGRTAEELTALPVADGWQPDLHAAWCRAAVRQRDAEWARALIGAPATPLSETAGGVDPAQLLAVLPEPERAEWAGQFIAAHGLSEAFRILEVCAVPWSQSLGRAVVDALQIARDGGSYPWSFSGALGLAERCLAPADADRLEPLAAVPDEQEGGSPGAGAYWAEAFQRLVATLRLRATIRAELDGSSGPEPSEAEAAAEHGEA